MIDRELLKKYFNSQWYLEIHTDVAESGMDPFEHFELHGMSEGRSPTPLFDAPWYLSVNGDVKMQRKIAFEHYVKYGSRENRNPNPFFDVAWYREKNQNINKNDAEPLLHYITTGQLQNLDPSPAFDASWYSHVSLKGATLSIGPLEHFLRYGLRDGLEPSPYYVEGQPVTDARMLCLRQPQLLSRKLNEIALFVTHAPEGLLKLHVQKHVSHLISCGISVILIVATNEFFHDEDKALSLGIDGLYVRENLGYDFAAWAHVLRIHRDLYDAKILYFINDSIVGPFNQTMYEHMISRVRSDPSSVVGLVDSYEITWHIQSYFIALKSDALTNPGTKNFFDRVTSHSDKQRIINSFELSLANALERSGSKNSVLFPTRKSFDKNPHIYLWRDLIENGFPFIKVTTLRDYYPNLDVSDAPILIGGLGYDVDIIKSFLAAENPSNRSDLKSEMIIYDRLERGVARMSWSERQSSDPLGPSHQETVLLISHEALMGGAPILVYNIMRALKAKYRVIVVFMSGGVLVEACRREGAVVIEPMISTGLLQDFKSIVNKLTEFAEIKFAVVNSVASRSVLPSLSARFVPTVSLIHEFASYIRPITAFSDMALWSDAVVFSTPIVLQDAMSKCPSIAHRDYAVVPQGRCLVPQISAHDERKSARERSTIAAVFDPVAADGREKIFIIGAGLIEYRKGVDLFLEVARRILELDTSKDWNFIWVGRGFKPDVDQYSMFLFDFIDRSGLDRNFRFLGEVSDFLDVCNRSNALLLTSRLDPLPNVAVDAFHCNLPVVCFDKTTGIADVLRDSEIAHLCVASYLDVADMAAKTIRICRDNATSQLISVKMKDIADSIFNFDRYVEKIESIALDASIHKKAEIAAAAGIHRSRKFDASFYAAGENYIEEQDLIHKYVRSWRVGINLRKPFPGFHPGVYRSKNNIAGSYVDPLEDFLRAGAPTGPWANEVIVARDRIRSSNQDVRAVLHIHCYYPEILDAMIWRIRENRISPDLVISVTNGISISHVRHTMEQAGCKIVKIDNVPNVGRDLGPLLTDFCGDVVQTYDIVGHVHTKKSSDVRNGDIGRRWYKFVLENAIGGQHKMMDQIIETMILDQKIGMVFPDDPHIIGWDLNEYFAEDIWSRLYTTTLPKDIIFPVGSVFWARREALAPLYDLNFTWQDFPSEPLPYDGSMLHAIERLLGPIVSEQGYKICTTHIPGVTR